jgi:hypothetical protein
MIDLGKLFSLLRDLVEGIKKSPLIQLGLEVEHHGESTKETLTAETGKNGSCFKREIQHKESTVKFHIGFLKKDGKDKPELFVSINNVRLLEIAKYHTAPLFGSAGEQGNEEGELWFTVTEQVNDEYFSDATPEARKDEIVAQILTEVAENLGRMG